MNSNLLHRVLWRKEFLDQNIFQLDITHTVIEVQKWMAQYILR